MFQFRRVRSTVAPEAPLKTRVAILHEHENKQKITIAVSKRAKTWSRTVTAVPTGYACETVPFIRFDSSFFGELLPTTQEDHIRLRLNSLRNLAQGGASQVGSTSTRINPMGDVDPIAMACAEVLNASFLDKRMADILRLIASRGANPIPSSK